MSTVQTPTNSDSFTAVQITDSHLFADITKKLLGQCTHKLLVDTVDHILFDSNAMPDMVFVTGDISQDETAQSYRLALAQFEKFNCPVYWIHGNHDDEAVLQPIFDTSRRLRKLTKLSQWGWEFISVNTCRQGTDKGYIEDDEYDRFLSNLGEAKKKNKKAVVVMHHHPVPVDTPLIDEYILQDNERFWRIAEQHKEIELIICGHVHGDYKIVRNKLSIEACPATCFQWKKGANSIEVENKRGYKIFNFTATSYTSSTVFI